MIGYPGLPNVTQTFWTGDAFLYETPADGLLEIRARSFFNGQVEFVITQVSPRVGLLGGLFTEDPENVQFSEAELRRVEESVEEAKATLATSVLAPEQLELINRKLDDLVSGSKKFGKKDFAIYVLGTLTGVCVSAALSQEARTTLFDAMRSAFAWFSTTAPLLLTTVG